ncbi:5-methyltetrahydropteroyltriglutamate--homocysteine S-methyltransferase [Oxynema aestuarii]|uniref:5-methyltetrahydropteroyltriglutamate--homocysteine S-methyltransferase n=1 Tax=Oxynema aestuarii AP17 TaxID=2064643 RepID=A0A6H1TWY0_9CYAN|nr:5-methyltetrahydropteroyltriglutamate--homocysteine S-methyltransferase [Oxynema aestuarii]QIZ70657.1 5-methyltetrahydropteroyltriglutamate--homocysteine S-methyltransferase [Oxynema aestuarii AP17]
MTIQTMTLGYARMGKRRELKKALEAFWNDASDAESLLKTSRDIDVENWKTQLDGGIDCIGVGDRTLYDSVLDWTVRLGLIPPRFRGLQGLELYFAMARGQTGIPALEMTKWFDTNYHYLVPEIKADAEPQANFSDFLEIVRQSRSLLGERAVPIVLSPVTLLHLSRRKGKFEDDLAKLLPLYVDLLEQLKDLGITQVQLHDPIGVKSGVPDLQTAMTETYSRLTEVGLRIHLVSYFDDLGENYGWVTQLPVAAIGLDFTRGRNLELLQTQGFPADKQLGVGMVDARNVWKIRPSSVRATLEAIRTVTTNIYLHPSASLQFVPHDATQETKLPEPLRQVLSFARQKLEEVVLLSADDPETALAQIQRQWQAFEQFAPATPRVHERLRDLTVSDLERSLPYQQRRSHQPQLPAFPTTTIGSFPQTPEVRKLRLQLKRGEITQSEYEQRIDAEIAQCIELQEQVGLDVLVHGEFERTDMVEFFGQKLSGFAFTQHGWVQSYGSRCVRPPIIYGDITRTEPMTVREFEVARSLTSKIVKGMLTGPVTMLNWSFPRTDIPRREQAMQIALALRDEVADLEAAGAQIIQIDEPALREGLPLKSERWNEYLSWAVDAFRLAAAIAKPETQIHTHMCYCEFGDIIHQIERLDADVLSIENSRSNNETLFEITGAGYKHQVGNGIYDVHAPIVPSVEQMVQQLQTGVANLPTEQIWVNPDCGLKTRRWQEVIPALKNMVEAAKILREKPDES